MGVVLVNISYQLQTEISIIEFNECLNSCVVLTFDGEGEGFGGGVGGGVGSAT